MDLTRRSFLGAAGAAALGLWGRAGAAPGTSKSRLGLVEHSFGIRLGVDRSRGGPGRVDDPLGFLEYAARLGAGGIQLAIGPREPAYAEKLRERAESLGMFVEASVRLPRDPSDSGRFEAEVGTARRSGAAVVRTVAMSGRRYETFRTAAEFRAFADRAFGSLTLAEPIVARHDVRLAIENHKDWRVDELAGILKRLESRHVGACVDTGNSIALLEDPNEVVEALAPWAQACHLKDMGVEEYADGFLLSEVPLGEGFLDLPRIVTTLRRARPELRFNLEMITRDPLKVPCLAPPYWATLGGISGRELARTLAMVRAHPPRRPLPRVASLPVEERLQVEEAHVRASLAEAVDRLGL